MDLNQTRENWNLLGSTDPLYGVLSHEGKLGVQWNEAEFFATGVQEIAKLMEKAKTMGLEFPRHRALDFGCAVGRLTQALAPYFEVVVGVDIATAMLQKAEGYNTFGERCKYVLNENPDLKIFEDASFDLIYSNIVLQHMAPRYACSYIAEFVRLLSPQGLLVFQLPLRPQYSAFRLALKQATPFWLLRWYRRMRYGKSFAAQAEIEMNGVPENQVRSLLEAKAGKLIHAEGGWYWVQKKGLDPQG